MAFYTVGFSVDYFCQKFEYLMIVGSTPDLGLWGKENGLKMQLNGV